MKYLWIFTVVMTGCLLASGAVGEDELKKMSRLVRIDSVRDFSDRSRDHKQHIVKVEFSSDPDGIDHVWFRMAVELTDKASQTVYLIEKQSQNGKMPPEDIYVGEGYWKLNIPCKKSEKMRVTAYVIQYGVLDGGTFVPFDTDCDKVKTYAELISRPHVKFPGTCRMGMTVMVEDD